MDVGRVAAAAGVVLFILLAFSPGAIPNEHGSSDLTPSYLYLKGEQLGTEQFDEGDLTSQALCREVGVYGASPQVPASEEHARVPSSPVYGATSCSINWVYNVQESFTFRQGSSFTFWLGCNTPWFGVSSELAQGSDVRLRISKNGEFIATGTTSVPSQHLGFCSIPGLVPDAFQMDVVFDEQDPVLFRQGDELWIWLWVSGSIDPNGEIIYIAVDSTQYPSALYGAGLPGLLRADFSTTITADVQRTGDAAPGNATVYPVVLENVGDTDREVLMSVSREDGWNVLTHPAIANVPAGGTATINLTVRAPHEAVIGAQGHHRITLMPDEEPEIVFTTTTHVVPDRGFPLILPGEEETEPEEPSGFLQRTGDFLQAIWMETLATLVVAAGATAAALFKKRIH